MPETNRRSRCWTAADKAIPGEPHAHCQSATAGREHGVSHILEVRNSSQLTQF
jgi:hypothetical protein